MFYQNLHYSFNYQTKRNLDYVYRRINLLNDEDREADAYSASEEFFDAVDEDWVTSI